MLNQVSLTTRVLDSFQTVTSRLLPLIVLSVTAVLGWQWLTVELSDFERTQSLGAAMMAGGVLLMGLILSRTTKRACQRRHERLLAKERAIDAEWNAYLLTHTPAIPEITHAFDPMAELHRAGVTLSAPVPLER